MSELSFSFTIEDYVAPFLRNQSPIDNATGISGNTLISVDILDDISKVNISTLDAYVNGIQAFKGPNTFYPHYNGTQSAITPTTVDGYDGYHLVIDSTELLSPYTPYTIRITVSDCEGNFLDDFFNFLTGTHISNINVELYEISLDVTFGSDLQSDAELTNPANYVFNNGMYARWVDKLNDRKVRLWVELFYNKEEFTLTVSDNIHDAYGNILPSPYNSYTISPFSSTATMSNYNGKVRTWHESYHVSADDHRIYLAGTKGIDVFTKEANLIPSRWAQIFDAYGINSMFVANFGGDYEFTDHDPPYISYRNPFPATTVSGNTVIYMIIKDIVTAVEIPSLTIYINDLLVFGGSNGGWSNNYSGNIQIEYQSLNITITPPSVFVDGEEVEVRVIAYDLFGNILDGFYSFFIGEIVLGTGFGGSAFGTSSFGAS